MYKGTPTFHIKWTLNLVIYLVFDELGQFTKTECAGPAKYPK